MNPSKLPLRLVALIVALLVSAAAAAHFMRPTRHLADEVGMPPLEVLFPKAFGAWQIDTSMPVILPAPDVQARLDKIYNQVLSRTYINVQSGQRIMLSVAYGGDQSDGTRLHRPEVCYPAQGFQILGNRKDVLQLSQQSLPVRHLRSQLSDRYEPITYWVVVGDRIVTSASEQKLTQLAYGVRGLIPDGMLVRVSSIDRDAEQAFRVHQGFVEDLRRAMTGAPATRVFGAAVP